MNYLKRFCLDKCLILAGLALGAQLQAGAPSWWGEWEATDSKPPNDDAAANIGQLKHMASKGIAEFEAFLPGGAGLALTSLLAEWRAPANPAGPTRDDSTALTVGQLKFVAKLFYDRLIAVGYPTAYPWTATAADDKDTAIANLGQIKYVFRFDLRLDANNDGTPDWKEALLTSTTLDSDGDGTTNAAEVAAGRDPFRRDDPAVNLKVDVFVR